jgi:pyruvate dehydrogenase E1 component alpha subunit/2-oxoisovalerate dehydrogenase E1 component alpha subunit
VPCVFVCVDNGWAISVPSDNQTAARSFAAKGAAYGIPGNDVDGNDVLACYEAMERAVARARSGEGPSLLVLKTYRMLGHSSSDDPTKYRDEAEVRAWAARDPVQRYERYLSDRGILASGERRRVEAEILAEIDAVIHEQEGAPRMPLKSLVEDVYADVPRHLRREYNAFLGVAERYGEATPGDGAFPL